MFVNDATWLDLILRVALLVPLALIWVIVVTRIIGLRSFSKMTAFDFVATVATGSLLANAAVATSWTEWFQPILAMFVLLGTQACLTFLRKNSRPIRHIVENEPLILFHEGEWNEANLRKTRTTKGDIWAKMREANVLSLDEVRTVVLETTGDVSVLHGDQLDWVIMSGVKENA